MPISVNFGILKPGLILTVPIMHNQSLQICELYSKINIYTAQKMKFSIKDFFRKLRIWSHLLKKSLMENSIFVECYLEK